MRRRVVAAVQVACPKVLLPWAGTTRLRAIAQEVCASSCERVAVVLGPSAGSIAAAVDGLPVATLPNVLWHEGVAAAIRCSVPWAMRCGADGLLLVDGEQAGVARAHLESLLRAFRECRAPVASYVSNEVCLPAVFGVESFPKLAQLTGDRDACEVLRTTSFVKGVPWPEGAIARAIDHAIEGALDSMVASALDVSAIPTPIPDPVESEPVVPTACST